jgi:twitching motility protein PilT
LEIYDLLSYMEEVSASDLHLSPNSPPIYRIDGELIKTNQAPLLSDDVHLLVFDIMSDDHRKRYEEELEIDFSAEFHGIGRFRVNVFRSYHGDAVVFRAINDYTQVLKNLCLQDQGLVLITGPTGCGKTTTLNTVIEYINDNKRKHIITIEDPVEYIHESKKSLVTHREVGVNTHSFANALRSALREDPDVIVVGEMRDMETTSLAISAAETGHLVFGTLHTMDAPHTIDRIIDQFPPMQQNQIRLMASESIIGVITQRLLKRKVGGRVAAFEILIGIPAVSNLIREGKTYQLPSVIQTHAKIGMISMQQSIEKLYNQSLITKDELVRVEKESDRLIESISGD